MTIYFHGNSGSSLPNFMRYRASLWVTIRLLHLPLHPIRVDTRVAHADAFITASRAAKHHYMRFGNTKHLGEEFYDLLIRLSLHGRGRDADLQTITVYPSYFIPIRARLNENFQNQCISRHMQKSDRAS